MRAYFIFLLCTFMMSANKSLEKKNFPSGWKCYKTIGLYISCAFIEIWSTWEVWRALKMLELFSATPQATPFSDQWSTKSILDKDSSDHWSAWSKDWSNTFLWSKDPNLIILPSNAQFQTGTSYISRKDCWQSLYKFCDKGEIKTIL